MEEKYYKSAEVAKICGVSSQTIRNWEENGKIPEVEKNEKGWRFYTESDLLKIKAYFLHKATFKKKQTRIISISNQKGGVAKTTTSINLGAALALAHKKKVLLIDMDMQAHLTCGLGIDPYTLKSTMYEILTERNFDIKKIIRETCVKNLVIAPAHPRMVEATSFLNSKIDRPFYLRNALRGIVESSDYDYIIIDCPPQLDLLFANAMLASTDLIIPIQPESYALDGVASLTRQIIEIKEGPGHDINLLGALITMYKKTNLHQVIIEETQRYFGYKCFKTIIPSNIVIAEASTLKKPVIMHQKRSKGSQAYLALAKEVLNG